MICPACGHTPPPPRGFLINARARAGAEVYDAEQAEERIRTELKNAHGIEHVAPLRVAYAATEARLRAAREAYQAAKEAEAAHEHA